MSNVIPTNHVGALTPLNSYPKHPSAPEPAPTPPTEDIPKHRPQGAAAPPSAAPEHHHTAPPPGSTALSAEALSSTDVSYVKSLMGAVPAQKMEEILLKTGVPIPANLGPNIDTAA